MRRWLTLVGALSIAGPGCCCLHPGREPGDIPAPKVVRNALADVTAAQDAMDSKVSIPGPSSVDQRLQQTGGGQSRP